MCWITTRATHSQLFNFQALPLLYTRDDTCSVFEVEKVVVPAMGELFQNITQRQISKESCLPTLFFSRLFMHNRKRRGKGARWYNMAGKQENPEPESLGWHCRAKDGCSSSRQLCTEHSPAAWQWITRILAISANLTLEGFFLISLRNSPRATSHLKADRQVNTPLPPEKSESSLPHTHTARTHMEWHFYTSTLPQIKGCRLYDTLALTSTNPSQGNRQAVLFAPGTATEQEQDVGHRPQCTCSILGPSLPYPTHTHTRKDGGNGSPTHLPF